MSTTTATRPAETALEKAERLTARYLAAFDRERAGWDRRQAAWERDMVLLPKSLVDEREDRRVARMNVLTDRKDAAELALARFLVRQAGTSPPDFRQVAEWQVPPAAVAIIGDTKIIVLWEDAPENVVRLAIRHTRSPMLNFIGSERGTA